jgi:hypothetical protein
MIWDNNASISRLQTDFCGGNYCDNNTILNGSTGLLPVGEPATSKAFNQVNDAYDGWTWSDSSGYKSSIGGPKEVDLHIRIYAQPGDDRIWSDRRGYFVVATLHQDIYERHPASADTAYGRSEQAESTLRTWINTRKPTTGAWHATYDQKSNGGYYTWNGSWGNAGSLTEYNESDGLHIYENDGVASEVVICDFTSSGVCK